MFAVSLLETHSTYNLTFLIFIPLTPISQLGKFGLIERISGAFMHKDASTIQGLGDDGTAAMYNQALSVSSQVLFLEGTHFDLTYSPLKHVGYKAATRAIGQLMAMNAQPRQLLVAVGLSKRFFVEDVDQLFGGIEAACSSYGAELAGLDIDASYTGITLSITALGETDSGSLASRRGAQPTDLLCISGNLGAAYMGLQLLEREKALFSNESTAQPQLQGKEYILQRYLRPVLRKELFELMQRDEIIPTSMCFLAQGLAQGVLALSQASGCGAKIFVDKIPLAAKTFEMAQELNFDALLCALNGGDDYEFLFSIPLALHEIVTRELPVDVIGHCCAADEGCCLVTPEGKALPLQAPGWGE